ncbi:hypothetical protein GCM10023148_36190 [Actinokineospora soli]
MDFRGLSRRERRQLDAIEEQLGVEAPDIVFAFRSAPGAAASADRLVFVALAALVAVFALFADAPLVVLVAMIGATAALIVPSPVKPPATSEGGPDTVPLH